MKNRILALILTVMTVVSALAFCVSAETAEQTQTDEPVGYDAALVESLMVKAREKAKGAIPGKASELYEKSKFTAVFSGQTLTQEYTDYLSRSSRAQAIEIIIKENGLDKTVEYNGKVYTSINMYDDECMKAYEAVVSERLVNIELGRLLKDEFKNRCIEKAEQWIQQTTDDFIAKYMAALERLPLFLPEVEGYEEKLMDSAYKTTLLTAWMSLRGNDPIHFFSHTYTLEDRSDPNFFDTLYFAVVQEGARYFYSQYAEAYIPSIPSMPASLSENFLEGVLMDILNEAVRKVLP